MELYLDTADLGHIARLNKCLPLKGVTTNPTILAKSAQGINDLLPALVTILGPASRFHIQVVSSTVAGMVEEAKQLNALPYDIVVKVPASEIGLAAIKKIKVAEINVLATAIYTAEQGFFAALCGADYLAPYVNRIHTLGVDGVQVVDDLQELIDKHGLQSKILAASFKSAQQALAIMKLGVGAITLPVDVAQQMISHPAVQPAIEQFSQDWVIAFGDKKAAES